MFNNNRHGRSRRWATAATKWAIAAIILFSSLFPLVTTAHSADANLAENHISIDFNNVDINVFIKFISELTGRNFVVDRRVKGNVTIISPSKISIKEAYGVFESVLSIHGFAAVEAGKVIKIIPSPEARSENIDTRISEGKESPRDRIVTRIIPLKFAGANELKILFTPLISKGSVALSYPETNTLIITDTLSNIERLLTIIDAVDVMGIGKRISVIPIENADAAKLVTNLSTIFMARSQTDKGKPDLDMVVKFVADERTNSIVALASDIETERLKQLVMLLDKEIPRGDEKIRVYYLEHASAENLAKVLQEIPVKKSAQTAEGKKTAPVISDTVKIMADKATNSLIIMAEKEDYPVLEEVIQKLDIPRSMVYIECLIMEVNVDSGLGLGTEWQVGDSFDADSKGKDQKAYFGGFTGSGILAAAATGASQGFTAGVMGESIKINGFSFPSIGAVVQAYQKDKDSHILSNPQILTTDNEEATLTIGKNVPYQTRSAAESGTDTYSSYEYKDVGITLKITPQISKDRLVRLTVFQEVTKLDSSANQASNDRPTTLKRKIETTLIVEDGNTVVIGGLIDETLSSSENKVPCLGDIPGLSYLFKSTSKGDEKTNLYVFLTPRVVKNPLEAAELYKIKKQTIDGVIQGDVKLYKTPEEKN